MGAGHGFDESERRAPAGSSHPRCNVESVEASDIVAMVASMSWADGTNCACNHDLIQLLDYARGPANDGASAKVGKRSNNHCASPPPPSQDVELRRGRPCPLPSHRLQAVLMHGMVCRGMCAWRSGMRPERGLDTWPQAS